MALSAQYPETALLSRVSKSRSKYGKNVAPCLDNDFGTRSNRPVPFMSACVLCGAMLIEKRGG